MAKPTVRLANQHLALVCSECKRVMTILHGKKDGQFSVRCGRAGCRLWDKTYFIALAMY